MRSEGAPLRGQPGLLWGLGVPPSGARRGQALQAEAQGRRRLEGKVFSEPSREGAEGFGFLKVLSRDGGGGIGIYAGPALLLRRRPHERERGFVYEVYIRK
jgi:hypothetical protein